MTRRKTIEDLQKEQEKLEQELKVKQQNLKMVKQQARELDRRNRTHRLCTHGAMLEQYLNPDEFSDELIKDILKEIFTEPSVLRFLDEVKLTDQLAGINPSKSLENQGRNYTRPRVFHPVGVNCDPRRMGRRSTGSICDPCFRLRERWPLSLRRLCLLPIGHMRAAERR